MSRGADIAVRFGLRVQKLRKAKGLSQETFAAKCGLDRTYISGIERGRRNVSLRNIEVIAKALGISISTVERELRLGIRVVEPVQYMSAFLVFRPSFFPPGAPTPPVVVPGT